MVNNNCVKHKFLGSQRLIVSLSKLLLSNFNSSWHGWVASLELGGMGLLKANVKTTTIGTKIRVMKITENSNIHHASYVHVSPLQLGEGRGRVVTQSFTYTLKHMELMKPSFLHF